MTKVHTTISLETQDLKIMRDKGINLSAFIRDKIRELREINNIPEAEEILKELRLMVAGAELASQDLDRRIKQAKDERDAKERNLLNSVQNIPECLDLSPEQLDDTKFMMDLVGFIRQKYPGCRIGMADINDYYRIRGAVVSV